MGHRNAFRRYLLPGFVLQSVVIAGGYGTGRELVEFFLTYGPVGGLLGLALVSTVIWSLVCVASFEFARVFRGFDYRTFFKSLLGPGWIVFEIAYLAMVLLVVAVVGATAGTILRDGLGFPYAAGVVSMMATVGFLVFWGSKTIERVLAGWSFLLYAVYIVVFVSAFMQFSDVMGEALTSGEIAPRWWIAGVRYAGYNLAAIAAVLFAVRHAESRRDAITAGILAGPIAILPAVLFYFSMIGHYPDILDEAVPATYILDAIGSPALALVFQVVLFGTLIETGTGLIHAVNERLAHRFEELRRELPRWVRPLTAIAFLSLAALLSRFGIIDLIANGYGTITWVFIAVYVIPILTLGVWKVMTADSNALGNRPE